MPLGERVVSALPNGTLFCLQTRQPDPFTSPEISYVQADKLRHYLHFLFKFLFGPDACESYHLLSPDRAAASNTARAAARLAREGALNFRGALQKASLGPRIHAQRAT